MNGAFDPDAVKVRGNVAEWDCGCISVATDIPGDELGRRELTVRSCSPEHNDPLDAFIRDVLPPTATVETRTVPLRRQPDVA